MDGGGGGGFSSGDCGGGGGGFSGGGGGFSSGGGGGGFSSGSCDAGGGFSGGGGGSNFDGRAFNYGTNFGGGGYSSTNVPPPPTYNAAVNHGAAGHPATHSGWVGGSQGYNNILGGRGGTVYPASGPYTRRCPAAYIVFIVCCIGFFCLATIIPVVVIMTAMS